MKVEVSPDLEGDADLVDIQDEYDKLIEQFKSIHKEHENLSKVRAWSTCPITATGCCRKLHYNQIPTSQVHT